MASYSPNELHDKNLRTTFRAYAPQEPKIQVCVDFDSLRLSTFSGGEDEHETEGAVWKETHTQGFQLSTQRQHKLGTKVNQHPRGW